MPSSHDSPLSSSSSSLISRHEAGSRNFGGGVLDLVSEEADEPPEAKLAGSYRHALSSSSAIASSPSVNAVHLDARALEAHDEQVLKSDLGGKGARLIHVDIDSDADADAESEESIEGNEADVDEDLAHRPRPVSNRVPSGSSAALLTSIECTDASSSSSSSASASSGDESNDSNDACEDGPSAFKKRESPHKFRLPSLVSLESELASKQAIGTGYLLPDGYDPSADVDELPPAGVSVSYVNPKLEARVSRTGSGIFALEPIERDTVLIVWTGRILTGEQTLELMDTPEKHYILQIGDGFYQAPLQAHREPADWTNHSCDPNAGFGKQSPVCLSAMKPIAAGEEVTFDYGMCETDPRLWEPMQCMCGSPLCRSSITAEDWRLHPVLWTRYKGFFSPHVQRRIDRLRAELEAEKVLPEAAGAATAEQALAPAPSPPSSTSTSSLVACGIAEKAKSKPKLIDRFLLSLGLVRASAAR